MPLPNKKLFQFSGPTISINDSNTLYSDQISKYISGDYITLGADGFGRSDTRKNLRKFFEVDKEHIVAYTLSALAKEQLIGSEQAEKAIKKYKIDKDKEFPANL